MEKKYSSEKWLSEPDLVISGSKITQEKFQCTQGCKAHLWVKGDLQHIERKELSEQ